MGGGKAQHRPSAHRLAHHRGTRNPQMVEQGTQVLRKGGRTGTVGGLARPSESAMVKSDASVGTRELGELLPPAQMIAEAAVCEDQRWPFAVGLVVKIDPG